MQYLSLIVIVLKTLFGRAKPVRFSNGISRKNATVTQYVIVVYHKSFIEKIRIFQLINENLCEACLLTNVLVFDTQAIISL